MGGEECQAEKIRKIWEEYEKMLFCADMNKHKDKNRENRSFFVENGLFCLHKITGNALYRKLFTLSTGLSTPKCKKEVEKGETIRKKQEKYMG
jgi:hypothetical protein